MAGSYVRLYMLVLTSIYDRVCRSWHYNQAFGSFWLRLDEISAVRFDLDQIHSGTGSPKLCWVYMVLVLPWNGTVPNGITFTSEPVSCQMGELI